MKKRLCIISILIVSVCLLCSCSSHKYDDALSMMDSGNYQDAIAIFEEIKDYEDSLEKIEICKAAIIENTYQEAISLIENGKYTDAILVFRNLNGYKESGRYILECNEKLCEEEYLAAKKLADSGNPSAYDAFKAFKESYEEKVVFPYLKTRDEGNPSDDTFVEFMKDKTAYEYYANIDKDISYVLEKHPELAQTGDHFFFGNYEQDNNLENGKEPIEWIIVNKENGRLKLASRYVLDSMPYHNEVGEYYNGSAQVDWANCTLRQWLNETFYSEAFSEEEQQKISVNKTLAYQKIVVKTGTGKHYDTGTLRYYDTTIDDYVFLDTNDVQTGDRENSPIAKATPYAVARGVEETDGHCAHWLMQRKTTHWGTYWRPDDGEYMKLVKANGCTVNETGLGVRPYVWIEAEGVLADEPTSSSNSGNKFTNKYGKPDTKCVKCDDYIASSGDTNACVKHSNKCLECNCYIDGDAMYCMSCITGSFKSSSTQSSGGCQYKYSNGTRCGATCTDYPSMCNKHMNEMTDIYNSLFN